MKEATIKININTQNAINSIDELNNEFNGTLSTIGDLRIASEELSRQLESTPVGTAKFQELQQSLIDVNGQLKNYELSIEALDNEQLASEIRSVVGGVMDLASGFVLLGASKESMEVIAQKFAKIEGISRAATGAMDIFNSGTKVMNSILTKSAAAQEVMAVATNASGVASAGAATKFRALTAAMMSNPLAAIAVAITAVVTALILLGDESDDAKEKQEKLNDEFERSIQLQEDLLQKTTAVSDYNIQRAELEGKSQADLLAIKLKAIDDEEQATKDLVAFNIAEINRLSNSKDEEEIKDAKRLKDANKSLYQKLAIDETFMNSFAKKKELLKLEDAKTTKENEEDATKKLQEENDKRITDYEKYLETIKDLNLKYDDDIRDLRQQLADYGEEENVMRILSIRRQMGREFTLEIRAFENSKKILDDNLADKKISQEKYDKDLSELEEKSVNKRFLIAKNANKAKSDLMTTIYNEEVDIERDKNEIILDKNLRTYEAKKKDDLEEVKRLKDKAGIIARYYGDRKIEYEELSKYRNLVLDYDEEYENGLLEDRAKRVKQDLKDEIISEEEADTIMKKIIGERDLLDKKYAAERLKVNKDTTEQIVADEKAMLDEINQIMIDKFDNFGNWLNLLSGPITQVTDILTTAFDNMNDKFQKSIDTAYNSGTEMYNKMYGEQLISREEYDNKIEILDQEKREKERQLARKAFNQQKALNIVNATMQGAQAVLSSYAAGASIPPLGPVTTGPAFAAIAGGLAAAQIGIIAAQKFKASRGGKVPGMPSKVDSVDAILAPGEMIINSNSSEMFAPILSAINQAGGGIPLAPSDMLKQGSSTEKVYSDNNGNNVVKAYVVESELTSTQKRVERLKNNASF